MGFTLYHYNPCVASKEIHGEQCSIVWYVYNTKISHIDPNIVPSVIEQIEEFQEQEDNDKGSQSCLPWHEHCLQAMSDYLEEAIAKLGLMWHKLRLLRRGGMCSNLTGGQSHLLQRQMLKLSKVSLSSYYTC
jgi:hypothetical protein